MWTSPVNVPWFWTRQRASSPALSGWHGLSLSHVCTHITMYGAHLLLFKEQTLNPPNITHILHLGSTSDFYTGRLQQYIMIILSGAVHPNLCSHCGPRTSVQNHNESWLLSTMHAERAKCDFLHKQLSKLILSWDIFCLHNLASYMLLQSFWFCLQGESASLIAGFLGTVIGWAKHWIWHPWVMTC